MQNTYLYTLVASDGDKTIFRGRKWQWCHHALGDDCQIVEIGPTRVFEVQEQFSKLTLSFDKSASLLNHYVIARGVTNTYGIDGKRVCMNSFRRIVGRAPGTIKRWASVPRESAQGKHESHEKLPRERIHERIELAFSIEADPDGPGEIGSSHYKYAESRGMLLYTHYIRYSHVLSSSPTIISY